MPREAGERVERLRAGGGGKVGCLVRITPGAQPVGGGSPYSGPLALTAHLDPANNTLVQLVPGGIELGGRGEGGKEEIVPYQS